MPILERLSLQTAGRDMTMDGCVVGPIPIEISQNSFQNRIYVAPLQTEMILGKDFFFKHGVSVNVDVQCLTLGSISIPFVTKDEGSSKEVQVPVVAVKRVVVAPNTARRISCKMKEALPCFMTQQEKSTWKNVILPQTVHEQTQFPVVCVVNLSDRYVTIKKSEGGNSAGSRSGSSQGWEHSSEGI